MGDPKERRRLGWGLAILWAATSVVAGHAFTGGGRLAYDRASVLLYGRGRYRGTAADRAAIRRLSPKDRLEKALELFTEAHEAASTEKEGDRVLARQARTHNALAVLHLHEGRFLDALSHSADAVRLDPASSHYAFNRGQAHFKSGDYAAAASYFETTRDLAGKAGDTKFRDRAWMLLVDCHLRRGLAEGGPGLDYALREVDAALHETGASRDLLLKKGRILVLRGGRTEEALAAWDEARKKGPLPPVIEALYRRAKVQVAAEKRTRAYEGRASGQIFTVTCSAGLPDSLAEAFVDLLDEAYGVVGDLWARHPSSKVHVTVMRGSDYETAHHGWSGGYQTDNAITIKLSAKAPRRKYRSIVFHEYSHFLALLWARQKRVPRWLNEGLAMSCEPAWQRRYKSSFRTLLIGRMQGRTLPLRRLATFSAVRTVAGISLAYATSLYAARSFINRHGGFPGATRILARMGEGEPFEAAFKSVTARDFVDFEREFWDGVDAKLDKNRARLKAFLERPKRR